MEYLPTWKPQNSTIHVGKYAIFPWILLGLDVAHQDDDMLRLLGKPT